MSFGAAMSLVVVAGLIFAATWVLNSELREAYRVVRAAGTPRPVAIPIAVALALLGVGGC